MPGIGIVTGKVSGNLELLEFDDKPTYLAFVQAAEGCGLASLVRRIEAGFLEESPKPGVHWLYRCDEIGGNAKLAMRPKLAGEKAAQVLIETRGEGGYVIVSPSGGPTHPSGKPYIQVSGGFDSIATITPEERADLFDLAKTFNGAPDHVSAEYVAAEHRTAEYTPSNQSASVRPGDDYNAKASWKQLLTERGWAFVYSKDDCDYWRRPGKNNGVSACTGWGGKDYFYCWSASTEFEIEKPYDKFGFYVRTMHNGNIKDAAEALVKAGYGARKPKLKPVAWLTSEDGEDKWRNDLISKQSPDGEQVVLCRVHNLALIMEKAENFKGRIRYNEFSSQIAVDGEDLEDVGPIQIKTVLEKQWIREKVPTGDVIDAMAVVAHRNSYHPIREYLDSLVWDGTERIPDFFPDFCGTPRDPYHMGVAHSLFVSAVARIYEPGCKVDTVVILISPQGFGKSKLWIALFGKWTKEVTESLRDKDFFSGLRGVWCADFGELDAFNRTEETRVKQVLTEQFDHYRPHYGRAHKRFPRQNIFVGGTNNPNYSKDPTGDRRSLPVKVVQQIDEAAVALVRDQLFAEAVVRFRRGEKWWDIKDASEHQEGVYIGDSWEKIIAEWLFGRDRTTVAEVLRGALDIEHGKQGRSEQTRAGSVLRRMGWETTRETIAGTTVKVRVYRRPPNHEAF